MATNQFFMPYRPAYDGTGLTIPGAQLYFTLTGTNTPSAPFADSGMVTPLSNPVIADAAGKLPPTYLNAAKVYRLRVYARDAVVGVDTPIEEYDPYVPGAIDAGSLAPVADAAAASATAAAASAAAAAYAAAIGLTGAPVGLFINMAAATVPLGAKVILTSGYSIDGIGSAYYVYDAAVDAAYVTANPLTSGITANGLGFRLSLEQDLTPEIVGAKGDGVTDDAAALAAISAFVNALGGGVVNGVQGATYLIGGQTLSLGHEGSGYTYPPDHQIPLKFSGCSKAVIVRGNGAKIKCKSGARYGTFNEDGASKGTVAPYFGGGAATPYYAMVCAENCTGPVHMENLELDGNLAALNIGGQYGDTGWQLSAIGLQLTNNTGPISFDNVISHHHALDGAEISGPATTDAAQRDNALVRGLKTYCNGRQGMSFVGGKGWTFKGCSFGWSGKANPGSDTLAAVSSAPGAGVDFESEIGPIRDINFEDCEFLGNAGSGINSDGTDVDRVTVRNSTLIGTTAYSIWPNTPSFKFYDCTILGSIVHLYASTDAARATHFYGCQFSDDTARSPSGALYGDFTDIASEDNTNVYFEECSFKKVTTSARGVGQVPDANGVGPRFHNCAFTTSDAAAAGGHFSIYGVFSGDRTLFANCFSFPGQASEAPGIGEADLGIATDSFTWSFTASGVGLTAARYKPSWDRVMWKQVLFGSTTYNPPSLALAAATTIQTFTLTGAAVGDIVQEVDFSLALAGARVHAWVSAANTVSFYFINENGTNPLDLASGTLMVKVRKA